MKYSLANIKKSQFYLDKNECVGIPTETVYGLAANAYSEKAIIKIYRLKKRSKKNPLIVHYYDLKMLKNDCEINNNFLKLYKYFCPGPITFVLKLKKESKISKSVTNNKKTLAVRFPKHPYTRKLLKIIKYPLAAPSANISKGLSPISKEDVKDEFNKKIKFILDGGPSKVGIESTIVNLINKPEILRLGGIEINKIKKVLKKNIKLKKINKNVVVPGQQKIHYSPGIPIRLNVNEPKLNEAFMLINKRKKSGKNFYYLSKKKNLKEAAKNLYKTLRMIKKKKFKRIAVEKIPSKGFGEAINDRLIRASKY